MRGGAQTVRFEIALLFLVLCPCLFEGRFRVFSFYGKGIPLRLVLIPIFIMWVPLVIAESNRAPFDFAEGERELVRGFKVEYGGILFSLLFLGEYGAILAFCWLSGILYGLGGGLITSMGFVVIFILSRGLLPRYRVDLLVGVF